ncbi:Glucose-methanol-choline (GMC) oxidoreductase:NAD binding site [Enhygromyxa salina]|uniref:Glucose-methanol-choline (GMC) oxidoreductase:NAD binding site n=1 Tax=Enhygromyxa salina TaxID=215803 RepID=A0A0C2CVY5_9BACT|nr:GMC family oxidoreductase [Enhygromyxa salina]KIG13780.1 Glucose-methanol-choline (GMC) oxidoreductase:NAD binding site [Enhygromyxa salina]
MASYDLILVGTSFASSFFLHEYLRHAKPDAKILVLERGRRYTYSELLEIRHGLRTVGDRTFRRIGRKPWLYAPSFGGTSNMWYGNTPRLLPEDFETHSRYGVGMDWPLRYDDLEPFYCDAEDLMTVAGPSDHTPFPRSRPYPHSPHQLSDPEKLLLAVHGDDFYVCPTARAHDPPRPRVTTDRAACCASFVCNFCPVDAKFTVLNGLAHLYEDPRVELRCGAVVQSITSADQIATGVEWLQEDPNQLASAKGVASRRDASATGEVIALGANALFNPHILLRSGLDDGVVGRYLHEQVGVEALVHLDGVEGFNGSTSCTGHHYRFARGEHRRERAAMLLETFTRTWLRIAKGRWRQSLRVTGVHEDLPQSHNRVSVDKRDPSKPVTRHTGYSDYTQRAIDRFAGDLETMFAGLPVQEIAVEAPRASEGHILGTARMGSDPATSVVDADQLHHRMRNLYVLGGSSFSMGSTANPSLTIAALSLRSAQRGFQ